MSTEPDQPKSPLFTAIDKNETEKALELLKNGEQAAEKDVSGMGVLAAAAYRGNLTIVEKAIELGCDVNEKTRDTLYTPLMFAGLSGKKWLSGVSKPVISKPSVFFEKFLHGTQTSAKLQPSSSQTAAK
uniref:ANK_REP_REGION domain-containing protein n=1 Tax=Caenorhabditis japonica TaxID=281687 RepID=A0A8R1DEN2_CAEJA